LRYKYAVRREVFRDQSKKLLSIQLRDRLVMGIRKIRDDDIEEPAVLHEEPMRISHGDANPGIMKRQIVDFLK